MAKYQFDEAFINAFNFQQKLNQQREEHIQQMRFNQRQLSLLDEYRDKTLAMDEKKLGYEMSQPYETKTGEVFGRNEGLINFETPLYTPTKQTEPIKQSRLIPGQGGKIEQQFLIDPITGKEIITDYGSFYADPDLKGSGGTDDNKGGKTADISGEVGEMNEVITLLDSLKADDDTIEYDVDGETKKVGKVFLRAKGKKFMSDAMTKSGVPLEGNLVTEIRQKSGITDNDSPQVKRQKLRDAIDYVKSTGEINDTQFEALKYWSEINTR